MKQFTKTTRTVVLAVLLIVTHLVAGCAAGMVETSQRVSSGLRGLQFNSVASDYMTMPTSVNIEKMRDGQKVLSVTVDSYGSIPHNVMFYERDITQCVAAIDKFLEWEKIAVTKQDLLEKEIAAVPAPSGMTIYFVFTSGNERSHYLGIGHTMTGMLGKISAVSFYLDRVGAAKLRDHLLDLPNQSSKPVSDDYR